MIRRDFLKKLAIGSGAAATLPMTIRPNGEGETRNEERSRVLTQISDLKKQLAQLEKSHKLLVKATLVGLSLAVGVDLATLL